MWSMLGALCSLALALFALVRSRSSAGYYDAEVYGMTPRTHRRYAAVYGAFTLAFIATFALRATTAAIGVFAAFTLAALFYLTSFLRGFSDSDD